MQVTDLRGALAPRQRGFSLAEMLLAVFILAIGVISIAALFPAGIALQRQAADDTVGPIVAKNAFATIRAKLSQEDFGSFQDFGVPVQYVPGQGPIGTIRPAGGTDIGQLSGDWGWMRPSFYTNATAAGDANLGTIDIFSANTTRTAGFSLAARLTPAGPWATEMPSGVDVGGITIPLYGIPYNRAKYPLYDIAAADPSAVPGNLDLQALLEPNFTFTQAERSYPQGLSVAGTTPVYHWDCMFRRNGGRVQVAVFVYRVAAPGGETRPYKTAGLTAAIISGAPTPPAGTFDATTLTPPIPALYLAPPPAGSTSWPLRADLTPSPALPTGYATLGYSIPPQADEIFGTHRGTPFAPDKIWDDWQLPNSWWIDNNGTVHKVLNGRTRQGPTSSAAVNEPGQGPVKLQRPIPIAPNSPTNGFDPTPTVSGSYPRDPQLRPIGPNGWIQGIWFVPQRDARGNILTPVFAAVEEL
jgi:prepilin-type N-terminal cleavage/methylation domain-containing protein